MIIDKWDQLSARPWWSDEIAKGWDTIRNLEPELGVDAFPISQAGLDAYNLWQIIKKPLLQRLSLKLTPTELKLDWHRQRLRRARDVLLSLQLIRRWEGGVYVLWRYSRLDELAREQLLTIHIGRELFLILGALGRKSKTQKSAPLKRASQPGVRSGDAANHRR